MSIDIKTFEDVAPHPDGYWGSVTSTVDWCERNYGYTIYVAEFYNTFSNILFIILALWGLHQVRINSMEPRFGVLYAMVIVIGLGSTAFHATLRHISQQSDETPMILGLMCWSYCLICMDPEIQKTRPTFERNLSIVYLIYGTIWTYLHFVNCYVILFQLHTLALVAFCLIFVVREMMICPDENARRLAKTYVLLVLFATVCWLLDQAFCPVLHTLPYDVPNPQFHAWWHLCTGAACYCGPAFLTYVRSHYLGLNPAVKYKWHFLPYVSLEKQL